MKHLKLLTILFLTSILSLTSCQDEIDSENGNREDTNNATSPTASNLERSSMYDGSFDDFLDGISCSSILLPVTATVNNIEVNIISESDYSLVSNILGALTDDEDIIELQFPLTVRLSNYTEVDVLNQTEYNALVEACETEENEATNAINCINIDFPITILTYNLNIEQTGSVVIESEQELYTYMNNFSDDALFSVNYPITATLSNDTVVEITSDIDLQNSITECLGTDEAIENAKDDAIELEGILIDGAFKVESFVSSGVDTASNYADYSINFANDLTVSVANTVNITLEDIEGTYQVASELDVFFSLSFSGNASFELLNHNWRVTSFTTTSISLQSTTDAAVTLVLTQI
jgi:hypothetical protein